MLTSLARIIGPLLFVALGAWQLLRWHRGGLRLPAYVHWLAAFGASVGVLLVIANSDLWRERPVAYATLPLVMLLLVYLAFGVYGGRAMQQGYSGDDGGGRARVVVDDTSITQHRPDRVVDTIKWSDLREVGVLTNDEGPLFEDVFFALLGPGESGFLVPQGADGSQVLVERLLKLSGFDEQRFIEAMGSTANRKFVCWSRAA
jgi:hypothetical protein